MDTYSSISVSHQINNVLLFIYVLIVNKGDVTTRFSSARNVLNFRPLQLIPIRAAS
jgi:hypothetical protein